MSEPFALPSPFTALIEATLNEHLASAPEKDRARLAGRAIAIVIEPPGLALSLIGAADRLQVVGGVEEPVDVQLSGSPLSLAAAMVRDDRSGLTITGDATVLSDLQHALRDAGIDWEDLFERFAGAGAAGPLRHLLDQARDSLRHFGRRTTEDLADYARDEAEWLPAGGAFEAFAEDVADLRDGVARLDARLRQLEASQASNPDDRQG
ncbi:SCP2 domain-containing protein [Thioalkalivibrio sp. ALMg11]|uniref:ubiquinone biosynthesis accessory factor UbiJ n=1 Tax=Thioalkalivibrio sp. ALMg11 TaxID=1158165 RepID=UPI00036D13B6|nr:sterol-binding protein [Thioalkalivibrio sp. ALMg11]